jgi:hypothetical protein
MRSHIVCEALQTFDRFQLCRLAAEATRKLHVPGHRVQDTPKDAFRRLAKAELNAQSSLPRIPPDNQLSLMAHSPQC